MRTGSVYFFRSHVYHVLGNVALSTKYILASIFKTPSFLQTAECPIRLHTSHSSQGVALDRQSTNICRIMITNLRLKKKNWTFLSPNTFPRVVNVILMN